MPQIFSARTDRLLRRGLAGAVLLIAAAGGLLFYHVRSSAYWGVGSTLEQPIGFRHDIHAGELGIGCTFCHTGAERLSAAGMPSAESCLICHRSLWRGTEAIQPLLSSVELGQPIVWKSLYRLPDHTAFHHGAHSASGIDCAACHGEVATMTKTSKAEPMSMAWCLDCHRSVGEARRAGQVEARPGLAFANPQLTDCSVCHY